MAKLLTKDGVVQTKAGKIVLVSGDGSAPCCGCGGDCACPDGSVLNPCCCLPPDDPGSCAFDPACDCPGADCFCPDGVTPLPQCCCDGRCTGDPSCSCDPNDPPSGDCTCPDGTTVIPDCCCNGTCPDAPECDCNDASILSCFACDCGGQCEITITIKTSLTLTRWRNKVGGQCLELTPCPNDSRVDNTEVFTRIPDCINGDYSSCEIGPFGTPIFQFRACANCPSTDCINTTSARAQGDIQSNGTVSFDIIVGGSFVSGSTATISPCQGYSNTISGNNFRSDSDCTFVGNSWTATIDVSIEQGCTPSAIRQGQLLRNDVDGAIAAVSQSQSGCTGCGGSLKSLEGFNEA